MDSGLLPAIVFSNYSVARNIIKKCWKNPSEVKKLNHVFISPPPCHTILDMAYLVFKDNGANKKHVSYRIIEMLIFVGAKTYEQIEEGCGGSALHGCHKGTSKCSATIQSRQSSQSRQPRQSSQSRQSSRSRLSGRSSIGSRNSQGRRYSNILRLSPSSSYRRTLKRR